ncbi:cytochrome c [Pseudoruegeria sp. HB172150]|uniref:cytochrome c n=1 Tax=Pseudoruegeria sp. HB172150 TaxID=2721164 RepID=UPI001C130679|nr:cytochrome c [Pseudoruegeria sp. HB172150]
MGGVRVAIILLAASLAAGAAADERNIRLAAPASLSETGLLNYILPRFSLKTQVKVEVVPPGEEAEAAFGDTGKTVFAGPTQTWKFDLRAPDNDGARRFSDWITSEIGLNTVTSFAPDGKAIFHAPPTVAEEPEIVELDSDEQRLGLEISKEHCRRCHVVSEDTRFTSTGSTPSFFLLRTFPDWEQRFLIFYVLNPHPAFTQIDDLTEPFPEDRPPNMVPVEMTLEEVEAVAAYVAGLKPADLGAPLQHQ